GALALAGAPVPGPHIGVLAVDADGVRLAYRKMCLGGAEPRHMRPGREPAVLDVDGWRLGLAVCKDTGTPEHAAATVALGADAYLAGVLESAEDAAVPDERARRVAAAHGVWVVTASFAGSTGGGYARAAGGSGIWSPDGEPVVRAGTGVGEVVTATLR
ncbi:carbon-nitrogen hydrolase family protein, partial [Micromonospora aurantiaca]|nr:carbon-nitrogen hydrolase family protein [Micromonospora aurantiaca]